MAQTRHRQWRRAKDDARTLTVRPNYEAFVFALVVLSIVNSCLFLLLRVPAQRQVVVIVQVLICVFLLLDATFRFARALDRRQFLFRHYGWLYFVGSLPLPFIALLRLVPTAVMVRYLRASDYQALGHVIIHKRAQSTLLTVILVATVVLEAGAITVLGAEAQAADANIKTASDALWWGVVTVATVGYGDRYPTTTQGRVIGVFVILVGVALFTSLSSFLAQWFLRQRAEPEHLAERFPADGGAAAPAAGSAVTWEQIRALLDEREAAHQREVEALRAQIAALQDGRASRPEPDDGLDDIEK